MKTKIQILGVWATNVGVSSFGQSATGAGVLTATASGCYGVSGGDYNSNGTGVAAFTANNCYGICSGNGYGVTGSSANNCYGSCGASGWGLYIEGPATGCYGYSPSGIGVRALVGTGCLGSTSSGTASSVTHNLNCF
jgi:hypothetical protein